MSHYRQRMETYLASAAINNEPEFENQGSWSDGFTFAKTNEDGVIVGPGIDNNNVFAQQLDTRDHKYIRCVARAQAIENFGQAIGAIQINWLGQASEFLSCSRATFAVGPSEIATAEVIFKVPEDAAAASLYVAPGNNDSRVHYFEMSAYAARGPAAFPPRDLSSSSLNQLHGKSLAPASRPNGFWQQDWVGGSIYFVHIPKTAGHSVYSVLRSNYPEEEMLLPYSGVEGNINKLLESPVVNGKTPYKIVAGHMPTGLHHYSGEGSYLTFLRNPLDLVISAYFFSMEQTTAPHYALQARLNRSIVQFGEFYDNILTRYLVTSSFVDCTAWLSGEVRPEVASRSFLGLDCGDVRSVGSFALQQWNGPLNGGRFTMPDLLSCVAVECSSDNFEQDIRTVSEVDLVMTRDRVTYSIPRGYSARYWRVRALVDPPSARWGVVSLRFFESDESNHASEDLDEIALQGFPISSSHLSGYPAEHAFDGNDRPALWQIPPGAIEISHCEEAIENLRTRFLFGLTEQFDMSLRLLANVFSWKNLKVENLNGGKVRRGADILSDTERKSLLAMNKYDVLVYDYAKKLFAEDIKSVFSK